MDTCQALREKTVLPSSTPARGLPPLLVSLYFLPHPFPVIPNPTRQPYSPSYVRGSPGRPPSRPRPSPLSSSSFFSFSSSSCSAACSSSLSSSSPSSSSSFSSSSFSSSLSQPLAFARIAGVVSGNFATLPVFRSYLAFATNYHRDCLSTTCSNRSLQKAMCKARDVTGLTLAHTYMLPWSRAFV